MQPTPPLKPRMIVQQAPIDGSLLQQTLMHTQKENLDYKRQLQEQQHCIMALRRDLAGATARLSDVNGDLFTFDVGAGCKGKNKKTCKSVWMMTWKCLVYILNGRYSGICGGTSYGQTSNPSERGRNGRFQNKWWWSISLELWCKNLQGISWIRTTIMMAISWVT